MSILDLAAAGIVGFNVLRGLSRGLVRTAFGFAAVTVASSLALKHSGWGAPLVAHFLPQASPWRGPAQGIAVWLLAFLAINLLGALLRMLVHKTPLRVVDRIGGVAFGLAVGAVVLAIPLLMITRLPLLHRFKPLQDSLRTSVVASALLPVVNSLAPQIRSMGLQ